MLQQVQLEVHDMTTVGWKKNKETIHTFLKQAINQWWIVYFFGIFFGLQVDPWKFKSAKSSEPGMVNAGGSGACAKNWAWLGWETPWVFTKILGHKFRQEPMTDSHGTIVRIFTYVLQAHSAAVGRGGFGFSNDWRLSGLGPRPIRKFTDSNDV